MADQEILVGPNQFMLVQRGNSGTVETNVGPLLLTLSGQDRAVIFDADRKEFVPSQTMAQALKRCLVIPQGWYANLYNPATDGFHPKARSGGETELSIGEKVVLKGPETFALWPGQFVDLRKGHQLRSNQFLVTRVYDAEAAVENWGEAVLEKAGDSGGGDGNSGDGDKKAAKKTAKKAPASTKKLELTTGDIRIIRGTDVRFYIPPTGIEVLPVTGEDGQPVLDDGGRPQYVHRAVTLTAMQYCKLQDENGTERIIGGPEVVFPEPTETFVINRKPVRRDDTRVFAKTELTEKMGLHVKVSMPYEAGSDQFTEGQELFITGADQPVYTPRPEHEPVLYDGRHIHYGVAIPEGKARYVMHRIKGNIDMEKGEQVLLLDPRERVFVRRVLDAATCAMWYPSNEEAANYNAQLAEIMEDSGTRHVTDRDYRSRTGLVSSSKGLVSRGAAPAYVEDEEIRGSGQAAGDRRRALKRQTGFTSPRAISFEDTKYDGAPEIQPWTGYAVMVVRHKSDGETPDTRVVNGPANVLMGFNEELQILSLSRSMPKTDKDTLRTVYLQTRNNVVSDVVEVLTKDLCRVRLQVRYRINFEGETQDEMKKWFEVENYVQLACDHLRSLLRNAAKNHSVQDFFTDAADIVRDAILGEKPASGERDGRDFSENNMRVYDVDVLDATIGDPSVAGMLQQAHQASVSDAITLTRETEQLSATKKLEDLRRQMAEEQHATKMENLELKSELSKRQHADSMRLAADGVELDRVELDAELAKQEGYKTLSEEELARQKAKDEQVLAVQTAQQELLLSRHQAEVTGFVSRAEAISTHFTEALTTFSQNEMAAQLTKALAPMSYLGGGSVTEIAHKVFNGTPIMAALNRLGLPASDGDQL